MALLVSRTLAELVALTEPGTTHTTEFHTNYLNTIHLELFLRREHTYNIVVNFQLTHGISIQIETAAESMKGIHSMLHGPVTPTIP